MSLNILIADDHSVVKLGTSLLIKEIVPDAIIHFAKNYDEVLSWLKIHCADLLICDINMPGAYGFKMIESIKRLQKDIKILVFSAYSEDLYALRYLKSGANGYLQKDNHEKVIKQAILAVLQNGRYAGAEILDKLLDQQRSGSDQPENPLQKLSNREIEVANLLVKGLGLLEICSSLNLQTTTVSTYKKRLFEKLEITNVPELMAIFQNYDNNQPVMEPEL